MLFARESNSRSRSLPACRSLSPDGLASSIGKTTRSEKMSVKISKQQTASFTGFPSPLPRLVQSCTVMGSDIWWGLRYTDVSLSVRPFSILHRRLQMCPVALFSLPFSYFFTLSVTQWPERHSCYSGGEQEDWDLLIFFYTITDYKNSLPRRKPRVLGNFPTFFLSSFIFFFFFFIPHLLHAFLFLPIM